MLYIDLSSQTPSDHHRGIIEGSYGTERHGVDLRTHQEHVAWLNKDIGGPPKSRGTKHRAVMTDRSFGFSEPTDHVISKLPSLPGTKKSNCFLLSDDEINLVNHRNLPCLRECCADPETWTENAPAHYQLAKILNWSSSYTGPWRWYHLTEKRGGELSVVKSISSSLDGAWHDMN